MSHSHSSCCSSNPPTSTVQSMDEMEFERGIWSAARDGDDRRVLELLDREVDPSSRDTSGYTALHYAARAGGLEVVRVGERGHCDRRY